MDEHWCIVKATTAGSQKGIQVVDNHWKWSPKAKRIGIHHPDSVLIFTLTYDRPTSIPSISARHSDQYYSYQSKTSYNHLKNDFLDDPNLIWIDLVSSPVEESLVRQHDLSVNDVYEAHHLYGVGFGKKVSIKEQSYNILDLDLKGIADTTELTHPSVTSHATDMATLVGGRGISFLSGQGVSASSMISTSFGNLFPEVNSYFETYNVSVQNHSYGVGVENYYGAEAHAYDAITIANPHLLHIFSSGNSGEFTALEGKYSGLLAISNLTGTFKQSKNSLVVGAIDSAYQIKYYSSIGPTYDGRIKPELVAYGGEGSSDAAAVVSGIASYLMDYAEKKSAIKLSAAHVKTILIASAQDIGNPGPDYLTGFGNASLSRALETFRQGWWINGQATGDPLSHTVTLDADAAILRVVLYWHDQPAPINEPEALINDLDIEIIGPNGTRFLPLMPSSYPNRDSLLAPAKQRIDRLNNVELIAISNPIAGNYSISVDSHRLNSLSQSYTIAYFIEEKNDFRWKYPTASNPLESGSTKLIRWQSTLANATGQVWMVFADENRILINPEVDLGSGFLGIQLPDSSTNLRLMMKVGTSEFYTDDVKIHPLTNPNVYLNCTDQLTFNWSKISGASTYTIFNEDVMLESMITDTSYSLNPNQLSSPFVAVRPSFFDTDGIRSYAINYLQQGAGCYIATFLARQSEFNVVKLDLELNGISLIDRVSITRSTAISGVETIYDSQVPETLISIADEQITPGIITYQVVLRLKDGNQVLSDELIIYYADGSTSLLFPNPIGTTEELTVISDAIGGVVEIIDTGGKLIIEWPIVSEAEFIPMTALRQGLYTYRIVLENRIFQKGKILVK